MVPSKNHAEVGSSHTLIDLLFDIFGLYLQGLLRDGGWYNGKAGFL